MRRSVRNLTSAIAVFAISAGSLLIGSVPARAAVNDLTSVASAASAAATLLNGANGISVVSGSESSFGTIKSFTSIDLGTGLALDKPGIFLTSATAKGADNSGASSSLRNQLSTILTSAGITGPGTTVTNVSSLSFDFTTTSSTIKSVDLGFLFASNELFDQEWDISAVIVDGVNYAKLANGKIWRVDPAANLIDLTGILFVPPFTGYDPGLGTWDQIVPINIGSNKVYSAAPAGRIVALLDPTLSTHSITIAVGDTRDEIVPSYLFISLINGSIDTVGGIKNADKAPSNVVAKALTAKKVAISFDPPADTNGGKVASYIATLNPGGFTQTLKQSGSGSFQFNGLNQLTTYTATVSAIYEDGTTASSTSNAVVTPGNVPATLSSLTFKDDGTGTGGQIIWAGKNIDAVLFTGPASAYPGPYNYGAFTSGWNGRIRNLTPNTSYTVSIYAISEDGVGESKSLTFKTSATLSAEPGAASATMSRSESLAAQMSNIFAWIDANTFLEGEGAILKKMLSKFDSLVAPSNSAYMKLPNSSVAKISAKSLTPTVCAVEGQLTVRSMTSGTCTISYIVTGGSNAPATLVKDFAFKNFAK